jgi:predicted glycoside hydrolase/deacetylase ChbG (UPF0249 family)
MIRINADDFGMNNSVNFGIIDCINSGSVNSVSVMTNMPATEEALQYLKQLQSPKIHIGLHINLTEGVSLSQNKVLDEIMRQKSVLALIVAIVTRRLTQIEIEKEITMQYKVIKDADITIHHFDTHNHIHLLPVINAIVHSLGHTYNVTCVRSIKFDMQQALLSLLTYPHIKPFILVFGFMLQTKKRLPANHLFDMNWNSKLSTQEFLRVCSSIGDNSEIICHPSTAKGEGIYDISRYHVYQILKDAQTVKAIQKLNVSP